MTLAVRAGGFSPGAGAGRVEGTVGSDPLDDARALLALTRLLYRARVAAARHGVLPARARARALVPLGRRLAEAMGAAEAAAEGSAARAAALERVAALGVEVWASVDPRASGGGAGEGAAGGGRVRAAVVRRNPGPVAAWPLPPREA